ncbi:hypothetical protein WN55_00075 [Dufourea novaeangliae]|uniref:Uncharacterized protein n=1 Tax=Dufourea novaeangliae TaxID=178035 RepID=A0A154NW27_DUFNO|nr:hypothetical protein WN55_00075 [Dufourea novaeangliae]
MDSSSSGGVSRNGVANKVREAGTAGLSVHENACQCVSRFLSRQASQMPAIKERAYKS